LLSCKTRSDVYFVSPDGNDNWSGKSAYPLLDDNDGPFRSINRAAREMKDGDSCYVLSGVYRETFSPGISGSSGNPIVFRALPGHKVTISCCDPLEGSWEEVSKGIFKAHLRSLKLPDLVLKKDQLMIPARWPNQHEDLLKPKFSMVESGSYNSMKGPDIPDDIDPVGSSLVGFFGKEWAVQKFEVTAYDPNQKLLHFPESSHRQNYHQPPEGWDSKYAPRKNNRFYLEASLDLLDDPNEYYFDEVNNEFYLCTKGNIPNSFPQLKQREYAIDLSDLSWIEIHDIDIIGGGILMNENTADCIISSIEAKYVDPGIFINGHNIEIRNSEIANSFGGLVSIAGNSNRLINNYIHDGNFNGTWEQLVSVTGSNHLISHNTVEKAGGGCISPGGRNNVYQYNDISMAGMIRHDIGGFYIANHDGGYNEIHHNRIHDIYGIGIYLDNSTSHYYVHHNLVWNCGWEYVSDTPPFPHVRISAYDAIRLNTPSNYNLIVHNTCLNAGGGIGYWGRNFIKDMHGVYIINNIFTGPNRYTASSVMKNNLSLQHPSESMSGIEDLLMRNSSKAIDAGMHLPGINDEFNNGGPDIGAFESGVEIWSAGHDFKSQRIVPIGNNTEPEYINLIKNGGFEAGTGSWEISDTDKVVHIQDNSWGLEDAATRSQFNSIQLKAGGSLQQNIEQLRPGAVYLLSVWMKSVNNVLRLEIKVENQKLISRYVIDVTGDWTFFTEEIQIDKNTDKITFTIGNLSEEGSVYIDDAGLIEIISEDE
jgi:hypothetical protein